VVPERLRWEDVRGTRTAERGGGLRYLCCNVLFEMLTNSQFMFTPHLAVFE
jgi:hypothetical protein